MGKYRKISLGIPRKNIQKMEKYQNKNSEFYAEKLNLTMHNT